MDNSNTVAVFVGPSGISPWHNEEMRSALESAVRTRDEYRVIPVLLPGASEEAVARFLSRRTWVDFRSGLDDAEAFDGLFIDSAQIPTLRIQLILSSERPST